MRTELIRRTSILLIAALMMLALPMTHEPPRAWAAISPGGPMSWGDNAYDELGSGNTGGTASVPNWIVGVGGVTAITGGHAGGLALRSDGTVWGWGVNQYGEDGNGTTSGSVVAQKVVGLTGVTAIASGFQHSTALESNGTVWTWGDNSDGQLGTGNTVSSTVPVQVSGLSGVTAIAAGDYHSMALKSDGTVWEWGYNNLGQLGGGQQSAPSSTPVEVCASGQTAPCSSYLSNVTAIAAGGYFSVALLSDGTVWDWGENAFGQLGDGTTTPRSAPVRVGSLGYITAIAAGLRHGLALKSDGTLWAWGDNQDGEIGNGTTSQVRSPVQVCASGQSSPCSSFLTGVTSIAAGAYLSVAIVSGGGVWAWGVNNQGELGLGKTSDLYEATPQHVCAIGQTSPCSSYLTGVTAVDAGDYSTFAVQGDSTPPNVIGGAAIGARPYTPSSWANSDVTVNWGENDPETGILSVVSSCTAITTLSADTSGTTLSCTATNRAGLSTTGSLTVKIDKTPPSISGSPTTSPNGNGWYSGNVAIAWTCSDPTATDGATGSGLATCPANSNVIGEGIGLTVAGTAVDNAGNTTTVNSPPVNIDRTAPVTTADAPGGWSNGPVTVKLAASDNLSGVAASYYTLDGGSQQTYANSSGITVSGEGSHTLTYWSVDNAGNTEGQHTITVNIDATAPTITHTLTQSNGTSSPNSHGWNNSPVTVAFTCSDPTSNGVSSGVKTCDNNAATSGSSQVTSDGASQSVLGIAQDNAGNLGYDPVSINLDQVPPTISASVSPASNGSGWYNTPPTVSFTCSDALSGISACSPAVSVTSEGAGQSISGMATDAAGNSSTTSQTVSVDRTAPTVTASVLGTASGCSSYIGSSTVQLAAGDALSGVASVAYEVNGGSLHTVAANGSPGTFTANVPVSTSGTTNISYWATDVAGNTTPVGTTAVTVGPSLTPLTGTYHSGGPVTVNGTGFEAGEQVTLHWDSATGPLVGTSSTVSSSCTLGPVSVTLPATPYGQHKLYTVGATSGGTTSTPIFILPTLTLSSIDGTVGSPLTITATGFHASSAVTATLDTGSGASVGSGTTDASGNVTISGTVPAASGAFHSVVLTDAKGTSLKAPFRINATVSASPSSGGHGSGATTTLTGDGYKSGTTVTIRWNCSPTICTTPTNITGSQTVSVGSAGSWSATVTIPSSATVGNQYVIEAIGTNSTKAFTYYGVTS